MISHYVFDCNCLSSSSYTCRFSMISALPPFPPAFLPFLTPPSFPSPLLSFLPPFPALPFSCTPPPSVFPMDCLPIDSYCICTSLVIIPPPILSCSFHIYLEEKG